MTHLGQSNAAEGWLGDDQVSNMADMGSRNEGAYNTYIAVQTPWNDTVFLDK